jgi:P27 family predicted phage terminase small subunit
MELGENGRARWRQLWGGPAQAWLARDIDVVRVTTVCQLTDDISTYRRLLAAMGPVLEEPIVTPTGAITGEVRVVANPLVKMTRDAEKNLDRELSTLGFDPVSRSRLGLAEVKRRSILEQLNEPTSNGAVIDAEVVEIAADC